MHMQQLADIYISEIADRSDLWNIQLAVIGDKVFVDVNAFDLTIYDLNPTVVRVSA